MFNITKSVTTKDIIFYSLNTLALTLSLISPHLEDKTSDMTFEERYYSSFEVTPEVIEEKPVQKEVSSKFSHLHNENNEYLLARIIASEYRSQDEEDLDKKVAVGLVVLNRVLSEKFPNTVEGVIFQRNQFQPTFDGSWEKNLPTEFDMKAAKLAFEDYQLTEGLNEALFFMNPEISSSKNVSWFRNNLTYVGSLGAHEFYK